MATDLKCNKIGALAEGLFGVQVNDALNTIKADLDNRGHDGQVRTLTIKIKFHREVLRGEASASTIIDPEVAPSLPSYRPSSTVGKIKMIAGEPFLLFEELSPENPDQPPLEFERRPPEQQA